MAVFDIFSKRQQRLRGELPDVYSYDKIAQTLREQIIQILTETLGDKSDYTKVDFGTANAYRFIVETLRREYGQFQIAPQQNNGNYLSELVNFLSGEQNHERVLDAVELSFKLIDRVTREYGYLNRRDATERADDAIQELNARFR